jgi:hypothetical protein
MEGIALSATDEVHSQISAIYILVKTTIGRGVAHSEALEADLTAARAEIVRLNESTLSARASTEVGHEQKTQALVLAQSREKEMQGETERLAVALRRAEAEVKTLRGSFEAEMSNMTEQQMGLMSEFEAKINDERARRQQLELVLVEKEDSVRSEQNDSDAKITALQRRVEKAELAYTQLRRTITNS